MTISERLVFVLLKVVEVGGFVFGPYWLGSFLEQFFPPEPHSVVFLWFFGALMIVAVVCMVGLCGVMIVDGIAKDAINSFVGMNKDWSKRIVGRFK